MASFAKAAPLEPPPLGSLQDRPDRSDAEDTRIPGHYIVVLKDSVERPGNVAAAQAERRDGELGFIYRSAIKGYSVSDLTKADVEALRDDPRVKYVSPDRKVEAFSQTLPTGIARIGATANTTADIDGQDDARVNVDVAVIDSGVDHTHPDLNVYKRTNCVPLGENPQTEGKVKACADDSGADGRGHGTHVAGTIGAIDNGDGVVGVAPGARIWAARVLNNQGYGSTSWIIAGVEWVKARASEIEVANMSLGCYCPQPELEEAIDAAVDAGVVFAVAAGNEGATAVGVSPAQNPNVITVSAMADYDGKAGGETVPVWPGDCKTADNAGYSNYGADDTLAMFSNWGTPIEAAAPGVCILSTLPGGGYGYGSGTSMASPHVAGAAALLASKSNPNSKIAVEAIRQQIIDEGGQDWTDIWAAGDPVWGDGYPSYADSEGSFDSVQEPLLDLRPQAAATYTTRAVNRKFTAAKLLGGSNPNGTATSHYFEYGPTAAYGSKAPASAEAIGSGTKDLKLSREVTGLKTNSTYHYRLVTTSSKGTVFGKDQAFTTGRSFFTYAAKEIRASSVKLEGRVNPAGLETSYQFEYVSESDHQASGWATAAKAPASAKGVGAGTNNVNVSELVQGLEPETAYRYRLTITNQYGTAFGESKSFTTLPAVVTEPATSVDARAARLEASINPSGLSTTYQFEWGTSKEYESVVPASAKSIGSGIAAVRVSEPIESLKPNTTYHYRVVASNTNGAIYGADETFTTASAEVEADEGQSASFAGGLCGGCDPLRTLTIWTQWSAGIGYNELRPNFCETLQFAGALTGRVESLGAAVLGSAGCAAGGFPLSARPPLKANGCRLELHPGREGKPGEFRGSIDIGGSECEGMTVDFSQEGKTAQYCKITIPPQNGIPATFEEIDGPNPPGKRELHAEAEGDLTYSQVGGYCPDGTFEGGRIWAGWDVQANSAGGERIGVYLRRAREAAVTREATALEANEATLNGLIDPEGVATTYYFQYVEATDFNADAKNPYAAGSKVPLTPAAVGSGEEAVAVDEQLTGLRPHTTYHFRVVADSPNGTSYGRDELFRTKPIFVSSFGSSGSDKGQLDAPRGLAVDAAGNLWVADTGNDRIQKLNPKGEYLGQFGSSGSGKGQFDEPSDVAITQSGDLWVADRGNARLQRFNAKGEYLSQFFGYGEGASQILEPVGVVIAPNGNIWVIDWQKHRVSEFTPSGELVKSLNGWGGGWGPDLEHAGGGSVDSQGNLWVTDSTFNRVQAVDSEGLFQLMAGKDVNASGNGEPDICLAEDSVHCQAGLKGTAGNGQFDSPLAIDVAPWGNVLVADAGRVQELTPSGRYLTQFDGGQISGAAGIATDERGSIYIADTGNDRIRKWCSPAAAEATTEQTADVAGAKVQLTGIVNPRCAETTYWFEYGSTTAYGSKAPVSPKGAGSGNEDVAVNETLEGLARGAVYHYRLVATNANGTTHGADRTFEVHRPRLEAESYPASISGGQSGGNPLTFAFASVRSVQCGKAQLEGKLAQPSIELSTAASYEGCKANSGGPATINMNSCRYELGALNQGPPYVGTMDIRCQAGDGIEIKVFASEAKEKEGTPLCHYKISPQNGLGPVGLATTGVGEGRGVEFSFGISKTLTYSVLVGTAVNCGKSAGQTGTNGSFTGAASLLGSQAGQSVGVFVAGSEGPAGLYLAGKESAEPSQQSRFESELTTESLSVEGDQDAVDKHLIDLSIRKFECSSVTFRGDLTGSTTKMPFAAEYEECTGNGSTSVAVSMNSCHYVLNVLNVGPPFAGSLDLACASNGDGVQIQVWAVGVKPEAGKELCVIKLPPQEGLGSIGLATLGSGLNRQVEVDFAISGLDYQRITGTAVNCGAANGTNGAYTGRSTLAGL